MKLFYTDTPASRIGLQTSLSDVQDGESFKIIDRSDIHFNTDDPNPYSRVINALYHGTEMCWKEYFSDSFPHCSKSSKDACIVEIVE
jgi:hypothetical protein